MGTVQRLRPAAAGVSVEAATRAFLANYTAAQTIRAYTVVLDRLAAWTGPGADLAAGVADPDAVAVWFRSQWGAAAPATWNARLAALRSAGSYWIEQGWIHANPAMRLKDVGLGEDLDRALPEEQVDALIADTVQPLRDRALWSLLYESVARSEEVLGLDVPDLDIRAHRAKVRRKGGARDVIVFQSRSAMLLSRLISGRKTGPVFLTDRRARPSVARLDIDPVSGRARLSYRRAAEIFEAHTKRVLGEEKTLHQLRHSGLTHAAEDGTGAPMLMTYSGHRSIRSLAKYARPSADALGKWQAKRDPAARRR